MEIKDIMTSPVRRVMLDTHLGEIKAVFDNTKFHHLLVVGDKKLVGVISDRDLLKHLSPSIGTINETSKDLAILKQLAHQIMSRHPITLALDASITDAVNIFRDNKISCIPIVDADDFPVGIVTLRDIVKHLAGSLGH